MTVLARASTARQTGIPATKTTRLTGVRRYQAVCAVAVLGSSIPYLWVLWDLWSGAVNPLRVNGSDSNPIYDVQARALMHAHFWIPNGSIGAEAFVAHGHQYTDFGIFPSLIRIPILLFTSSLDGQLFGLSIFGAWIVTAAFCSLLLWRLRILLRGDAALGWLEAVTYGVLLASILVGSVLVFLASRPDAFNEDEAWSVALACASLFALVGVIERPSWQRVSLCGVLVLLTNLNRNTTGYAAILGTLLVAGWFGLGRAGRDRQLWAIPLMVAGLVPLAIGCAIDEAKFGLLFGVPFSQQLHFKQGATGKINGGHYISLHWLPSTVQLYLDPANFGVTSVFPYIVLPEAGARGLLGGDFTANVPLSMPLLFFSGLWGTITAFARGRSIQYRSLRLLLIASAVTIASIMVYGWIFERFTADFMPFLILASMIGLVDVWRRMSRASRTTRVLVPVVAGVLAIFGFWVNMGFAITPNSNWSPIQARNYIAAQRTFSNVTGHPLDSKVVSGNRFPGPAPSGTIFDQGHCRNLYLLVANIGKMDPLPWLFWIPVERSPTTPICHSLVGIHPQS